MPKGDFVWFLMRNNSYRCTGRKSSGAIVDSCLVFVAESLLWRLQEFLGSSHHGQHRASAGGKVQALESLRSETMSKFAEVWYECCAEAENGAAREWC